MSHPFDATLKDLGTAHAADFLALFDSPTKEVVKPLNVDLSTVTTSADLVYGIGDPLREVIHLDFQASAVVLHHAVGDLRQIHARFCMSPPRKGDRVENECD